MYKRLSRIEEDASALWIQYSLAHSDERISRSYVGLFLYYKYNYIYLYGL